MSFGSPEILVIVVLVLLLFGPDRMPELMRTIARGMRQVRRITSDFQSHFDLDLDDEPPRRAPRPAPPVGIDNNETIPPPAPLPASSPSLPLDQAHLAKPALETPADENEKKREA